MSPRLAVSSSVPPPSCFAERPRRTATKPCSTAAVGPLDSDLRMRRRRGEFILRSGSGVHVRRIRSVGAPWRGRDVNAHTRPIDAGHHSARALDVVGVDFPSDPASAPSAVGWPSPPSPPWSGHWRPTPCWWPRAPTVFPVHHRLYPLPLLGLRQAHRHRRGDRLCRPGLSSPGCRPRPGGCFFRLAIVVTLVLWLPDLWILWKGQPGKAVAVLMVMHLAIALVTYNGLVHLAPAPPTPGAGRSWLAPSLLGPCGRFPNSPPTSGSSRC